MEVDGWELSLLYRISNAAIAKLRNQHIERAIAIDIFLIWEMGNTRIVIQLIESRRDAK